jgi:hypothetical protein
MHKGRCYAMFMHSRRKCSTYYPPANHNYWKETKAALIEKERRKAEALARRQTRSFAY